MSADPFEDLLAEIPAGVRPRVIVQRGDDRDPLDSRWFAGLEDMDDEDNIENHSALGFGSTPAAAVHALAAWLRRKHRT